MNHGWESLAGVTGEIHNGDVPAQVRVGIVGLIGATLPAVFDPDRVGDACCS